jgi:hypothetical protein
MHSRQTLIALATVAVAALVPASAMAAGGQKAPRQASFKAKISGTQDITWSYSQTANGPCTADNWGNGEAQIQFGSTQAEKVTAYEIRKGNPLYADTHGRPMIAPSLLAVGTANVNGDVGAGPVISPEQCEDNGGGVVPQPKDCGQVTSYLDVSLSYVNRNKLLVRGNARGWADDATDGPGSELRGAFDNCPYWSGGPYWDSTAEGDIEPVDEPLKEAKLFDPKQKKITVHGGDVNCFDTTELAYCGQEEGPFRGKVVTAWKLTLTRVK